VQLAITTPSSDLVIQMAFNPLFGSMAVDSGWCSSPYQVRWHVPSWCHTVLFDVKASADD
jgi:hypothetical protein